VTAQALAPRDRPVLRRGVRHSSDPLTGAAVLLFPEGVLVMNETAARVVACCDGIRTVEDVLLALAAEYDGVRAEEVLDLLDDLVSQHLMSCHG
jgi:pyrroloquinoline quinone biosynthesis protein D